MGEPQKELAQLGDAARGCGVATKLPRPPWWRKGARRAGIALGATTPQWDNCGQCLLQPIHVNCLIFP